MNKRVKIGILAAMIVAALVAVFFIGRHFLFNRSGNGSAENAVYVESVGSIMGTSASGMSNVFAGVVESPETWSVQKNDEYTVQEVFVKVGDVVKEGDKLFAYDAAQFNKDLSQAEIDLERLNNELESMNTVLKQLESAYAKASGTEKSNYEIQIEEQKLEIKQKEIDIQTKELDMKSLQNNIENAEVVSGMDGIVRSINDGNQTDYGSGENNAYITVMQIEDLRIKGTVNEQNIGDIAEGLPVKIISRVNKNDTWSGTVSKVNTDETTSNNSDGADQSGSSSNYSFYVSLEDSTGLILGQHVTVQPLFDAEETLDDGQLRLYEFYIDMTDENAPFVWADENGKLVKRAVTLGEYDEDAMTYVIASGLSEEDKITYPDESYEAGMPTTDEMVVEEYEGDGELAGTDEVYEEDMVMEGPGVG